MNRQNFIGHLALALTIILVAGFVGYMRRAERHQHRRACHATPPQDLVFSDGAESPWSNSHIDTADVLVRFRTGTSADTIARITSSLNDRVEDRFEAIEGLTAIDDRDNADTETILSEYRSLPEVEYAEPNSLISLEPARGEFSEEAAVSPSDESPTMPNDPMFGLQWSLNNSGQDDGRAGADIRALNAWTRTRGEREVVVAVLDSGVDYTHPDLVNNMWTRPANIPVYTDAQLGTINDSYGFNAVENTGDPMDDNGHGTHCAGIIGAEGGNSIGIAGVNWQVSIMPLKFMSAGGHGTTRNAIEAINYVIARKQDGVNVRIISASWGSTVRSRALEAAIRRAGEEGILFIAASGNSSANADRRPHYPASYDLPNVISVAALNRRDELASFSNYGARSVHIAAPGADVVSTWLNHDFESHSGTSMATPTVAGVAALVLAVNPDLSIAELRQRLLSTVDRLDSLNGRIASGGRLNAARAVSVN
jgi:thermitase